MIIDIMSVLAQAKGSVEIEVCDPAKEGIFSSTKRALGKTNTGEFYYTTREYIHRIRWYWYDGTVRIQNPTATDMHLLADIMALPVLATIDPSLIESSNQKIVLYTEDHEITVWDFALTIKRSGRMR